MNRAWLSISIILGVVPELMRAWKPEMAPQAMVMKTNGHTGPGMMGPPPATNGVVIGMLTVGWTMRMPRARASTVPIFM